MDDFPWVIMIVACVLVVGTSEFLRIRKSRREPSRPFIAAPRFTAVQVLGRAMLLAVAWIIYYGGTAYLFENFRDRIPADLLPAALVLLFVMSFGVLPLGMMLLMPRAYMDFLFAKPKGQNIALDYAMSAILGVVWLPAWVLYLYYLAKVFINEVAV